MFQITQSYLKYYLKKNTICNIPFEGLMTYLSNNRGRNYLDKWFTQKLSFSHMSYK